MGAEWDSGAKVVKVSDILPTIRHTESCNVVITFAGLRKFAISTFEKEAA